MSDLRHYIDFLDGNGFVEVIPPQQWKELNIEISFLNSDQKLSASDFTWTDAPQELGVTSVSRAIKSHIDNGLTGGVGIFEGLPYQVRLICDTQVLVVLDCCINFCAPSAQFRCDTVIAPVMETGKIDFLSARAESFRFEYLYSLSSGEPGKIYDTDFIDIYYQIGRYPQATEIMVAALTLYVTLKELYETTKNVIDAISATVGGATGAAETALQIAALVAYLVLIVIALVNLINQLIDLIFPWVYYHRGMLEITLWQRACAYLGLNYNSSIHASGGIGYNNYIMPPKQGVENGINPADYRGARVGQVSSEKGFYAGTFADFIRGQIEKYNGKVKIIGNNLYFETDMDYFSQASFNIPMVKNEFIGYNASEVPATYVISYQYDSSDLFSYSKPEGVQFQITVTPTTVVNKKNILLRNLQERIIPYTLPCVKTTTSTLENIMSDIFNGFANFVNAVAQFFGANSPLIPVIPNSINVIQLDTHFTSLPRTGVYLGGGYTDPNTSSLIGAEQLFYSKHFYNCPKPIGTYTPGNQWKRYSSYRIPMCCEDYLLLKDMNYAYYNGVQARLLSIRYNPYDQIADIDFEVNEKYTDNLSATIYRSGDATLGSI